MLVPSYSPSVYLMFTLTIVNLPHFCRETVPTVVSDLWAKAQGARVSRQKCGRFSPARGTIGIMTKGPMVRSCTPEEYAAALGGLEHTHEAISFLQAPFYGAWQERDSKKVVYFAATEGGKTIAAGLAIKYDAPGGISFFYCPY